MRTLINLTPHDVTVVTGDTSVVFPKSGTIARVSEEMVDSGLRITIEGGNEIPVYSMKYGKITDLPDAKEGVLYIVSTMLRLACPERYDLISPCGLVRNEAGLVVGCMGFQHQLAEV